jgi:indole-3-glycerol phosphate synthase
MREIEEEMGAPRNILEKIIWDKEIEVAEGLARNPLKEVIESAVKAPPTRDFYGALAAAYKRNGVPALIAEVKKASPSRGVIRENFDPVEIAQAYEKHGAACLSILTDEKYFQGSFENLRKVRKAGVKCPLLCKEFVIDEWQIYYARSIGADAVLLIAAVLTDMDLKYLLRICKELGLTALIEVHDENEMERVLRIDDVQLIGINNRSLETFIVDTSNTKTLLEKHGNAIREKGILVVGESGLFNPDDVAYVQNAGVSAVLVGESLVKQEDPGRAIAGLFGKELLH